MPRYRIQISGRVQGVGFRWFARNAARARGIAGWVMNRPDGSVLCEAQGRQPDLDDFVTELRKGPHGSRVDELRVDPEPDGQPDSFEIR